MKAPPTHPPSEGETESETAAPKSPPLLFVVEDEAPIRTILKGLAEEFGYETVLAPDGARALALARELGRTPTLALVDFSLPGTDGIQVLSALLGLFPSMRAVVMSGHAEAVVRHKLNLAGINAEVLPKPFGMTEFEQLLTH